MKNALETEIKVREIILEQAGSPDDVSQISLGDRLFEGKLGMDSLDIVELGMALEEEFSFDEIPASAADRWRTVGDVVRYVQERKAGA